MKRVAGVVVVAGLGLVLTGCSSAESDAVKVAQEYVTGTWKEQCELEISETTGNSRNCENSKDEVVWANHPTDVESVTTWKEDGYAVVIPDEKGIKDVIGLREINGEWRVMKYATISESNMAEKDPACWALSEDTGVGC